MSNFKNIPNNDKPRERLYLYGAENLSNEELLSIIIKTGTKNHSVKEVSLNLLSYLKDINKLSDIGINTLMKIDGIGRVKAIELKAAIELGKRVNNKDKLQNKYIFNNSLTVYNFMENELTNKKQEYFYCLYLDTKKNLIEKKCLFIGTINMSLISPREIFKEAYLNSASSFICVHNHPTGDSTPSKQDKEITRKLQELGQIHEIPLVDHIIIGKNNYYSFCENNVFWITKT